VKLEAWAVGITDISRGVPGEKACDKRHRNNNNNNNNTINYAIHHWTDTRTSLLLSFIFDKTRLFIICFRLSHYVKYFSPLHWANLYPLDGANLCATRSAQSTEWRYSVSVGTAHIIKLHSVSAGTCYTHSVSDCTCYINTFCQYLYLSHTFCQWLYLSQ